MRAQRRKEQVANQTPSTLEKLEKRLHAVLERDVWRPAVATPHDLAPLPQPCRDEQHNHAEILVEVWKKTVDVQQHFNDVELRIRNFAVTVFAATFGALAYALEKPSELILFGVSTPLTTGVIVVALTSWLAFYFMDRWWYHQLLLGAVLEGIDLENHLAQHFKHVGLAKRIGEKSPIKYGYPTLVFAVGALLLAIARWNEALGRGLLGIALAIAILTYRRYRRVWPERFSLQKRWGLNDVLMLGAIVAASLLAREQLRTAIGIVAFSMFVLTYRMARHHSMWRLRSTQKVDLFYLVGFMALLLVGVMLHYSPPRTAPLSPDQDKLKSGASAVTPAPASDTAATMAATETTTTESTTTGRATTESTSTEGVITGTAKGKPTGSKGAGATRDRQ